MSFEKLVNEFLSKVLPFFKTDKAFGPLSETVPKFELVTILHCDELIKNKLVSLNSKIIFAYQHDVADHSMYAVENDKPVLYLGRIDTNPIFQNIEVAFEQLNKKCFYELSKDESDRIKASDSTLRIPFSGLKLERYNEYKCFFDVNSNNFNKLKKSNRLILDRAFGYENLKSVIQEIYGVKITVSNPEFVMRTAKSGEFSIPRCLNSTSYQCNIFNELPSIDGSLRGVLKLPKNGSPDLDYDVALDRIVQSHLAHGNNDIAIKLLDVVKEYIKNTK